MEMNKVEVKIKKPIYLGQAILDISKTLMYEFWYDYIKPKYGDKARLCYSFVMHIKTEDFYKDIAGDVERRFDTTNYDEKDKRPLPIGKNKNVIGMFKDELGGKIMTEFCALRAKLYAYKLDDDTEMKKAKGTKKCIVKREITFKNYADALFNDEVIIRSQQRFISDHHNVYTEEVNKIALGSNDDKRIQTFDISTTFPYGTNVFKVRENEMQSKMIKDSAKQKEETNMPIIESNRTDNDLFVKYDDFDLDDELKELTEYHLDMDTEDEMNIPIIESNRTDNDFFAKYDNDDFDLDDELKELTEHHLDIDTEDEMMEDKIDDDVADDKTEHTIEEEQEDTIEDNKERTTHLDKINRQIDQENLLARIRNDFSKNVEEICRLMNELHGEIYSDDSWLRLV